jgi:hypothetical protein
MYSKKGIFKDKHRSDTHMLLQNNRGIFVIRKVTILRSKPK